MFAVAALIVFILDLFEVTLGDIDLTVLGLALVAAHLAFAAYIPLPAVRRRE